VNARHFRPWMYAALQTLPTCGAYAGSNER
jgi:hypothetical protein